MYFAMAETAFASVSRVKLKTDADRGDERAKKALFITDNFDRAITTILICTNIIHISAASVVTVQVTRLWGVSAVTLSTIITTVAVFFVGEMLPKSIARKYSERISLATAGALRFFMLILKPVSALLTAIGNGAAKLTKGDPEASVTEDELYDIIEDMTHEGSLDEDQGDLISSALQFGDVTVESILTARVDLAAIDVAMSHSDILAFIKEQRHSRLPVYEGSIDNIIGVLQIRTYIKAYLRRGEDLDIRPLLDEAYFVHQSTNIDELLPIMSKRKLNMAVVTDNYGGTLGVVTVEDILEELVGEIWDEDDTAEEPIVTRPDGSYEVDSGETVGDVFDALGVEYDEEEDDELINKLMGELCYEQFPSIPAEGDSFVYRGLEITVAAMQHNRILKLRVRVLPPEETPDEGGGEE
jgi:CBS domain containing-hemolysin-like protein